METDEFFDLADEMGLLIMPGWTCCDMWEHWKEWTPETYKIAGASLKHELDRLRNHPSVYVWLYGSDNPPPEDVEKMYLQIFKDERWPNPTVSSASQTPSAIAGPSGVKMTGPYEYVPASYWLTDKEAGGAHGYNTETSPGPAIPPLESLERFIPRDHLWPIDDYWNYHAGLERFTNINVFRNAIEKRYGPAQDLNDFLRKSQAQTYEGERAMFEAYARNKYDSTGVIQWMLNNGWPSLIWHLYDYYLVPAGGYFGTKKATELLHAQYGYDDNSVSVINQTYEPQPGVHVGAALYDINAKEVYTKGQVLDLAADSSTKVFDLPKLPAPSNDKPETYFLRVHIHNAQGQMVSINDYWLSTKPDVIDFAARTDTDYTPQKDFTDFTALNSLPPVKLDVTQKSETKGNEGGIRVTLHNPSKSLAFMVHARLTRGKSDDDVVPIFWSDNYVSLLPGETRELSAHYDVSALQGKSPELIVDGWNVAAFSPRSHGDTEKTAKK
jgi:exo-1,4-beta-D-glucosaminidase